MRRGFAGEWADGKLRAKIHAMMYGKSKAGEKEKSK